MEVRDRERVLWISITAPRTKFPSVSFRPCVIRHSTRNCRNFPWSYIILFHLRWTTQLFTSTPSRVTAEYSTTVEIVQTKSQYNTIDHVYVDDVFWCKNAKTTKSGSNAWQISWMVDLHCIRESDKFFSFRRTKEKNKDVKKSEMWLKNEWIEVKPMHVVAAAVLFLMQMYLI